jgi:hypothetical protein
MARNDPGWKWTAQKARAAAMTADGRWTEPDIVEAVGISRRQLVRWKGTPQFKERVEQLIAKQDAAALKSAIARKGRRLRALGERWASLQKIARERGRALAGENVPGGGTGYLAKTTKMIGAGERSQVVTAYELDADLLRELRAHEEAASKECGQWCEREAAGDAPPIALAQVIVQSREDAQLYLERVQAAGPGALVGVVSQPPPAPPGVPSLAQAVATADVPDAAAGYDGPAGI